MLTIAIETAASGAENQDRVTSFVHESAHVIVVSDGAGGMAGGALAAQYTIDRIDELVKSDALPDSKCVMRYLATIDQELAEQADAGECTGVVLVALEKLIWGASVGDSAAWMVGIGPPQDLTVDQRRKPLLGTGQSRPVAFGPLNLFGCLVIASDGLFNYVKPDTISTVASMEPAKVAAPSLVDAGRLASGDLQDDVTVVVCKWHTG